MDLCIDTYKDKCIEQKLQMDELYSRIFNLKDEKYTLEDKLEAIKEFLLHSNITIEEMEKVGAMFE